MSYRAAACALAVLLAVAGCSGQAHLAGTGDPASSSAPPSPPESALSPPPGLSAGCQLGTDDGGFAPAGISGSGGPSAFRVSVRNGASAVTVTGFAVTFTAYGSQIGTASPTVEQTLMEPGETWDFTVDDNGGVQVSEATYLASTCTVTSVLTGTGPVTPAVTIEPDGNQVSRALAVQSAQSALAADVQRLAADAQSLDGNTSLGDDVSTMTSEYGTEEGEYRTEQGDTSCGVTGDASAAGGDASAVGGDLSALKADISYLEQYPVAAVQSDLSAVRGDLGTLAGLGAAGATAAGPAAAAGSAALKSAASAITWAQGQGRQVMSAANALAATAQTWASEHPCS